MANVIGRIIDQGGHVFNAEDPNFGIVGDGTTNDSAAINNAITAVVAAGGGTLVFGARVYGLASPVEIATDKVRLEGRGFASTTFKALAAMPQVIRTRAQGAEVDGIKIDANVLANHGLDVQHSPFGRFRVQTVNALFDGIHLSSTQVNGAATINDAITFDGCQSIGNGRVFATSGIQGHWTGTARNPRKVTVSGTVNVTAGSSQVTGVGTNFTAIPTRRGDVIVIGNPASATTTWRAYQIQSVNSATGLTLLPGRLPDASGSALQYAVCVGDGYREDLHNDNNINRILGGLYRNNAGSGVVLAGLYGTNLYGTQIDYNGAYGTMLNFASADGTTIAAALDRVYFEGNGVAPAFFGSAYQFSMREPNWDAGPLGQFYHIGNPIYTAGILTTAEVGNVRRMVMDQIGSATIRIPCERVALSGAVDTGGGVGNGYIYSVPFTGVDATRARIVAQAQGGGQNGASPGAVEWWISNRTTGGFTLNVKNVSGTIQSMSGEWVAFYP